MLMRKLLKDRALIPDGHLVEIKYEDLETEPIAQLQKIYDILGLPGFTEAEPCFVSYLDSIAGYQKNIHPEDDLLIEKVNQHWQFALEALGYERLVPAKEQNTLEV
jgi:hypothetical protein